METPRVLAKIIGPLLIIPAAGVLFNLGAYQHVIEEFSKSVALCYLGGFVALLFGIIILHFHNSWEAHWTVIITILGWISVVKGAALIIFPGLMLNLWQPYMVTTAPLIVSSAISIVVGVFLTIKGYRG